MCVLVGKGKAKDMERLTDAWSPELTIGLISSLLAEGVI